MKVVPYSLQPKSCSSCRDFLRLGFGVVGGTGLVLLYYSKPPHAAESKHGLFEERRTRIQSCPPHRPADDLACPLRPSTWCSTRLQSKDHAVLRIPPSLGLVLYQRAAAPVAEPPSHCGKAVRCRTTFTSPEGRYAAEPCEVEEVLDDMSRAVHRILSSS